MNYEHPRILYVGNPDEGRAVLAYARRCGWHVYLPQDVMQALAMAVFYAPDVAVVDFEREPEMGRAVYEHLQTLEDAPPVIGLAWEADGLPGVVLPPAADVARLLEAVAGLASQRLLMGYT
jgi:hypothetical protein